MKQTDWLTKVLLAIIAAGLWVLILRPAIRPTSVRAAEQSDYGVGRWRVVNQWSGTGALTTPRFTVGNEWRIRWVNHGRLLSVTVYRPGSEMPEALAVNTLTEESNVSYVYKAGSFCLGVNAIGGWTLTVEELGPPEDQGTVQGQSGAPPTKVLRAERFEAVDSQGTLRAGLGVMPDGRPGLLLADKDGKPAASLFVLPDGSPALGLFDKDGTLRAGLSVRPDGSPALGLQDTDGKLRAMLSVDADGSPGLALRDKDGKVRAGLSVRPDGTAGLVVADAHGKLRAMLAVPPNDSPALTLLDKDGKVRAGVTLDADGDPSLGLADKDGRIIWKAP